jgi:uncharacterized phage infection (PIP) family protein YhgE
MNIQEIIALAQTLHDEIDKAAALATKAAPFLVQARGLASSVIGKLNTHNAENPQAPAPAPSPSTASTQSTPAPQPAPATAPTKS